MNIKEYIAAIIAITATNPQNKSLFARRGQETRARTAREMISKRMSSMVGGLCCPECGRENGDGIESFSITVAPTYIDAP